LRRHATGSDRAGPRARPCRTRRGGRDGHHALQTDLTGGRVLRGARRFIAGSKVPRARSVLVDASSDESHLDPITAAPARNQFLQTVVPFLRKLRRSAP
jgi:hypothetical protein